MIDLGAEDSINEIENMVIDHLKEFGNAKISIIIKHIWNNATNKDLYLDHIPNEEAKTALTNLVAQNRVKFDEETGLYYYNETIETKPISESEIFNSKWHLRVMGNYLLKSSQLLPLENIDFEFNNIDLFESRLEDDFSLKCTWKKEGIISNLYLDDTSEFVILVYFSSSNHPELVVNDILLLSAKNELMKTALGTGFFMMHSACKKILLETVNTDIAVIHSYELLENK